MDEQGRTSEGFASPLQGPHWHRTASLSGDSNLAPLRLVMQPGAMSVDVRKPSFLVGRHSESDLRLPFPEISRRHCRFVHLEHRWQVVDLNSLNGIYVNGDRVKEATLCHHDMVSIGGANFLVDLQPHTIESANSDPQRLAS